MKILFFTPSFYPTTGGLESVARSLAKGLSEQNYIVKILTFTPLQDAQEINEGYEIIRTTHKLDIFKLYLDCNIFVHHNISLKGIWPLFLFPKKWVVLHHLTYYDFNGKLTFLERIKRYLSILANNVSVSNFVNQTLPKKGEVIHNPYNEDIFYLKSHLKRAHRLLFVGRLVSDKGCLLLLESIHKLKMEGIEVYLSIIGDGPEQAKLKKYCRDKKIEKLDEDELLILVNSVREKYYNNKYFNKNYNILRIIITSVIVFFLGKYFFNAVTQVSEMVNITSIF